MRPRSGAGASEESGPQLVVTVVTRITNPSAIARVTGRADCMDLTSANCRTTDASLRIRGAADPMNHAPPNDADWDVWPESPQRRVTFSRPSRAACELLFVDRSVSTSSRFGSTWRGCRAGFVPHAVHRVESAKPCRSLPNAVLLLREEELDGPTLPILDVKNHRQSRRAGARVSDSGNTPSTTKQLLQTGALTRLAACSDHTCWQAALTMTHPRPPRGEKVGRTSSRVTSYYALWLPSPNAVSHGTSEQTGSY